jgi:ketosteroid isomerase-like protein
VLLQLERDWEQANTKNDVTALERILAPEFVSTDSDSRLMTRADLLARRKSGAIKGTAFTQDDYKVHVIGDTAIVIRRVTLKAIRDGKTSVARSALLTPSCVAVGSRRRWRVTPAVSPDLRSSACRKADVVAG